MARMTRIGYLPGIRQVSERRQNRSIRSMAAPLLRRLMPAFAFFCLFLSVGNSGAQGVLLDPPHDASHAMSCESCHIAHHAAGVDTNSAAGNANLCLSCHAPGGKASARPLLEVQQALPWPGLPADVQPSGSSHRWDSSLAGHVEFIRGATPVPVGTVQSSGDYTGRVAKTYSITITQGGAAGVARFSWTGSPPAGGGASNLVCGTGVPLSEGVSATFKDGASSPSFRLGDRWDVYVRPDVSVPTNALLSAAITNGLMSCSTCHNQHSQALPPFDPSAPAYGGQGTGAGRHFQRADNSLSQICRDCHAARNVTNAAAGSHPVGVSVPATGYFKSPASLPLSVSGSKVECQTCHDIHNSASSDGDLLRVANRTGLCTQCHTLADTASPAAHLSAVTGPLWPGGQYGSTFPQRTDATQRGTCANCHVPHGWPDAASPAQDYPFLLVDREENLCFTCHDNDGPAVRAVKDEFAKAVHHPVADGDSLRRAGRSVECTDCHNTHRARSDVYVYTNTATATRNQVDSPNLGVSGVAVSYAGLGNFVAPALGNYTATNSVVYEYQICFKCHSGYAWLPGSPPTGISSNGTASSAIETDLALDFSPMNRSGHPVVTGLDNYTNSTAVSSKRGLQAAALTAPWTNNVGQQTMSCADCHNTDLSSPAAQGPHGSAAQFMLRTFAGSTALPSNWPNVTLANYATSWCANCHNKTPNTVHSKGNHSSVQCYLCHIVVPHGGKMSRLIADHDAMPVRYAYTNAWNARGIKSFTKKAASSYTASDCQAGCTSTHNAAAAENW